MDVITYSSGNAEVAIWDENNVNLIPELFGQEELGYQTAAQVDDAIGLAASYVPSYQPISYEYFDYSDGELTHHLIALQFEVGASA